MAGIYHLLDERGHFSEKNGGAISRWAANVLNNGPEIVVCPSSDGSWNFPQERIFILPNWGKIASIHPILYRLPWPLQKAAYIPLFGPLLSRMKPGDIVYVHNRPAVAAVLAAIAERHKIKVALHLHNSMLLRANRGQRKALQNIPIIYCSNFLRQEVERALPGYFTNTHVVFNGADAEKFSPAERDGAGKPQVIYTGRLIAYKGIHILTKAMGILEEKGIDAECKIVGGFWFGNDKLTPYVRKLKREAPANCELVGYRSGNALAELLRNSDIFCCPSIWNDPFPLAPLEGMAAGLPVVASDVGGLPEALAYGGGILVPAKSPQKLADALASLLNNAPERKRLGKEGRAAVMSHFLWSNVREQYQAAIAALQSPL